MDLISEIRLGQSLTGLCFSQQGQHCDREVVSQWGAIALAAALYITGYPDIARKYMGKFSWGHAFLSLNKDLLDRKAACAPSSDVVKCQNEFLALERESHHQKRDEIDLPPIYV
ncbi:hypothetical protein TCAL_14585 [Tigriopus californicus]|uniref:16S/18S rRNA aminocarboxypropyltransferase Tsr3 C-terminal domain-containing protein n=1 Tax=Tigriopus californicus TaxID=6832 RepID=A0A553PBV8_TIGCA|nr:hypothetical protein TCAL_14585 [Tigriopus californicus]|eukprot:TCALIF_13840-PA protein Name:"Similar to TSR3 Ribosome biogenesis protein TSR3 homolog (Homo sapiens)" AED:0.21 eAED:0.22 QI:0/0/0/1/1/1/2/0/113